MIRGTTPTHRFNVPVDMTDAEVIYISYRQDDRVLVEKTGSDIAVTDRYLEVRLSQRETLLFSDKENIEIQIRAKFSDGTAIASNIIMLPVGEVIKYGVI